MNSDWICTACNVSNFASRVQCFKCQSPKENVAEGGFDSSGRYGDRNAPKAGDWTCPACKVNNFAKRTSCFKCNTNKPTGEEDVGPVSNFDQRGGGFSSKPGDWNCSACDFSNYAKRTECLKCKQPKDDGSSSYSQRSSSSGSRTFNKIDKFSHARLGDWTCSSCQFLNFASRSACMKCDIVKPSQNFSSNAAKNLSRPGDWKCEGCNFTNFASRNECLKCQVQKPF